MASLPVNLSSFEGDPNGQREENQYAEWEEYETVKQLGAGGFAVTLLVRHRVTGELVAAKLIERTEDFDVRYVTREILNHQRLRHESIVRFLKVVLTPTHLAIFMEYAAGGEIFSKIQKHGRFNEDGACFFFRQLAIGTAYLHNSGVVHRDLKLENTLLDDRHPPRVKIADFGYSKSRTDSNPKTKVGTPAYMSPEVLSRPFHAEYDGKAVDIWSLGVCLYLMLTGEYPFQDPGDPQNKVKSMQRTIRGQYSIPRNIELSQECRELFINMFNPNPAKRFTIQDILNSAWFHRKLPPALAAINLPEPVEDTTFVPTQDELTIARIVGASRISPRVMPHLTTRRSHPNNSVCRRIASSGLTRVWSKVMVPCDLQVTPPSPGYLRPIVQTGASPSVSGNSSMKIDSRADELECGGDIEFDDIMPH